MSLRRALANAGLVAAGVLLAWLLAELLFPLLLPRLRPAMFHHLTRELQPLGQSSKAGLLPRPGYVGLAGDSHAQGKGDWFVEQGYDRNARFHSAHLLQERLGRDVLSFGRSGAGSIDGIVLEPLQVLATCKRLGLDLPPPELLYVYFYEGNDLHNNGFFLETWFPAIEPGQNPEDPAAFQEFLERMHARFADGRARQWNDVPLFANFALRLLRNTLRNTFTRRYVDVEPPLPAGENNRIRLGERVVALPDRLQAPPLDLTEQEIRRGVAVFMHSLRYLQRQWPTTRLVVVYIPAPLTCYRLASEQVSIWSERSELHDARRIEPVSDALARAIAAVARDCSAGFIDARPELRAAGQTTLLHGPRDWDHFNRQGYETLTRAIVP